MRLVAVAVQIAGEIEIAEAARKDADCRQGPAGGVQGQGQKPKRAEDETSSFRRGGGFSLVGVVRAFDQEEEKEQAGGVDVAPAAPVSRDGKERNGGGDGESGECKQDAGGALAGWLPQATHEKGNG